MNEELISLRDAAKILGVAIETMRRWDNQGKFRAIRFMPNSKRMYRKADIEKLLSEGRRTNYTFRKDHS